MKPTARSLVRLAVGAGALGLSVACAALTGNEQVSLASQGRFAELAAGLEADVARGVALKTPDQHALCYAYSRLKRYDRIFGCLDTLDRLLAGRDKATRLFGLDDGTATAPLMRAEALIELASYEEALTHVQAALDWFRREKANDMDILVDALAAKTLAQLGLGRRAEAERTYEELANVKLGFLGSEAVGAKALAQARAAMALGRWKDVIAALDSDRTLGIRSFLHNLAGGAYLRGINEWVWLQLPRAYMYTKARLELGQTEDAKTSLKQLLGTPELAANGGIYWLVLADMAGLAEKEGDDAEAEKLYERAIEVIERQRRTINSEANKIGFAGDKQALYQKLVQVQIRRGRLQNAFQTAERGKARALVDLLAAKSGESLVPPDDPKRGEYTDILKRMSQAELEEAAQDPNAIKRATGGGGLQARSLAKQLPASLTELVSVSPLDFAKVQGLLAPDESLLLYFGYGKQLQAFVLTPGGVRSAEINADGLEEEVKAVRTALGKQDPKVGAMLRQLHTRLIQPVQAHLTTSRLTIVPHGALHYVPFAALNDGSGDLIDRHSIRMLPSVSVLNYLKRPGKVPLESMFVLGNPDLGDPKLDLPGAEFEARQLQERFKVNKMLLRRQATRNAFREFAPGAPLIHVASHGEFDAAKPLHSGLMLSMEGGSKGGIDRLTVSDLYGLKLDAALVTLSACETGLGSVLTGDDVIGLTRGFLYAGAGTVIASLWAVDDEATAYLMLRMYDAFQKAGTGDFLREAQLETRKKYPNPLFWAAFYRTGL